MSGSAEGEKLNLDYSARFWIYLVLHCHNNIPKPSNLSTTTELQCLLIAWKSQSLLIRAFRSWGFCPLVNLVPSRNSASPICPILHTTILLAMFPHKHTSCEGPPYTSPPTQILLLWNPHVLHTPLPLSPAIPLPFAFTVSSHVLHCYIAIPFILSPQ